MPVTAVVTLSVLDAPYLEATVPHALGQARFPFAERLAVVDRRTELAGEHPLPPRSTPAELDSALRRLVDDGVVDRVIEAEQGRRAEVMERYFGTDPGGEPAVPPVYPILLGLEAAAHDHVAHFAADAFFWNDGSSWIEHALAALQADGDLWLVQTHAGPPGQASGATEPVSASDAWDERRGLWRTQRALGRSFLCDRRRLRGQLQVGAQPSGPGSTERCLSEALARHGAHGGRLAADRSWSLRSATPEPPFAEWARALADAVAAGHVPAGQRGREAFDLRDEAARGAWADVLKANGVRPSSGD